MNAEGSALLQSFPWVEGTAGPVRWRTTNPRRAQPGTRRFRGGAICTRVAGGRTVVLPGCRGPRSRRHDATVDGTPAGLVHPFTGQRFKSEAAAASWNLLMLAVVLHSEPNTRDPSAFDPNRPFRRNGCSFRMPQFCALVAGFAGFSLVTPPRIAAGGNGRFGRRDFAWAGAGQALLRYEKRNVLGFSMDFAEDVTRSSWSIEFTWQEGLPYQDQDELDGLSDVDTYNVTISADRPTRIAWLNPDRSFIVNSQLFVSYVDGYHEGMVADGPWTFLWLLMVQTGYYQDRLLLQATSVYDFRSNSGAFLAEATWKVSDDLQVGLGVRLFAGRWSPARQAVNGLSPTDGTQIGGRIWVENGLSPLRDLDGFFVRLQYSF